MSYSKYYLYKKQYSNDSGVTWYDVTPLEQVPSGNPIGTYETLEECQGQTPPTPYENQYLTVVALDNCVMGVGFDEKYGDDGYYAAYSLDSGATWNYGFSNFDTGITTPLISAGNKVMWKGGGGYNGTCGHSHLWVSGGTYNLEGNIMSMLEGDYFSGATSFKSGSSENFISLFGCGSAGCGLISAENLVLPATVLTDGCYKSLFWGQSNLIKVPKLPATTLAEGCYEGMFQGCSSLTTAPTLPATTLAIGCYFGMFNGCTSLTTAPQLPATTLTSMCYLAMFGGCTSLTTAPQLPATRLTGMCYLGMFAGCTSLTTAPQLPATTLANYCYEEMFSGCTNLNSITCLATDISASYATTNWVNGVSSSGTFTKASSMSNWTTGTSGIPSNWTVQNAT